MLYTIVSFIILTLSLVNISSADDKKKICTKEEAIRAENEIDKLNDWDSLYNSFKRFAHCDDAAISEGYSDVVVRLLASDWKHFRRLFKFTSADKQFEHFILRHIDEIMPSNEVPRIKNNIRKHCPSEAKRLCKLIECKLIVEAALSAP